VVRATEHDGDMDEATALILTLEQTPADALGRFRWLEA